MRVTRVIREFVEKEIYAKAKAKKDEISGEYNEQKEKCCDEIDNYMDKIVETTIYPQICVILRKYGMDIPPLEQGKGYRYGNKCYINYNIPVTKQDEESRLNSECNKIRIEAEEKIKNILLDLELGANKSELKEMLERVKF